MKKIIFLIFLMLAGALPVMAGESQNVWGYAWSEGIGWISFNCDNNRNGNNDCSGIDYGVNIKNDGCLEGYAWSENIGWISFDQSQTGNPQTDETSGDCLAEVYDDSGTTKIRGWARVLSGKDSDTDGFDGWIKFNDENISLSIDNSNPREFLGYAWGDVVNGWIKFNSKTNPVNSEQFAVYTDYSAKKVPKQPTDFKVELGPECAYNLNFSWKYNAPDTKEPQKRIEIEVSQEGVVVHTYSTSISANDGDISNIIQSMLPDLGYNTSYDFKIRVSSEDIGDYWSNWSDAYNLTTHPLYPDVNFAISPTDPKLEEVIELQNNSTCDGDDCTWQWTIEKQDQLTDPWSLAQENNDYKYEVKTPGEIPIFFNQYDKNPKLTFLKVYNYGITLSATDPSLNNGAGITCDSDRIPTRPQFEEIKDTGPDDIQWINELSGTVIKVIPEFFNKIIKALKGLDF